ncbi:MAG TPA: hypothetical protein PLU39_11325 [Armatimonadota bacterium]|jgi:predicted aconitase|nr:hypothetical protein [Armatimonadota bacterium]HOQ29086.1 hypothetical protein [Armatimonadota bacterium]HPO73042.1 hypothetical protein [Armatimonadota bacterium]HPT98450.1 hypothetical protein [Armatimonadota bacterium]
MRKSRALEKMRRGEYAFSRNIRMAPSPELVETAGPHRAHEECEALLRLLKTGARESGPANGLEGSRA